MKKRSYFLLALLLPLLDLTIPQELQATPPPNILMIVADDLNDFQGVYGHPLAQTPHLDTLASQSLRFDRAYNQYPLCGPSRASFMTGLYPGQNGVTKLHGNFRATVPDAVTLSQFFMNRGYHSARIGKIYHYNNPSGIGTNGNDDSASWDERHNPKGIETEFTDIRVLHRSGDIYTWELENDSGTGANLSFLSAEGTTTNGDDRADPLLHTDGLVASKAVELIDAYTEEGQPPFFLSVGFYKPHTPFIAPKQYFDLYDPSEISIPQIPDNYFDTIPSGHVSLLNDHSEQNNLPEPLARETIHAYLATISFMDDQIGRVLAALDDPNGDGNTSDSIRDNTIVVFTSDHGYHMGEHEHYQKKTLFEESARVPLLISAPGTSTAGSVTEAPVELIDLYRTLADLTGNEHPQNISGVSLAELMHDVNARPRRAALTQMNNDYSIRAETKRYTRFDSGGAGKIELYDTISDFEEMNNLAYSEPTLHGAELAELDALLDLRVAQTSIPAETNPFVGTNISAGTAQGGSPLSLPDRIEAESYNDGGANVAWFDTTADNDGGFSRTDDVDIEPCSDIDGGGNITQFEPLEWLAYTVNVAPGHYRLHARTASPRENPGTLEIYIDQSLIAKLPTEGTGGWQNWQTVVTDPINLTAYSGEVTLVVRRSASGENFNWNWLEFEMLAAPHDNDGDGVISYVETANGRDPDGIDRATLPYLENFEGLDVGALALDPGLWSIAGTPPPATVTGEGVGASQALKLPAGAEVSQPVEYRYLRHGWTDFRAKLIPYSEGVAAPEPEANANILFYLHEDGSLRVLNGSLWQAVPVNLDANQFHRYTIKADYESHTWSVWVDGVLQPEASDLAFAAESDAMEALILKENHPILASIFDNVGISETAPGSLDAAVGTYEAWSATFLWNGVESLKTADANGNGVVNLLEYLGGNHPIEPGTGFSQEIQVDPTAETIQFRFLRNLSADDVSFTIWTSKTLDSVDWTQLSLTPEAVSTTPFDETREWMKIEIPILGTDSLFIQLRASTP